MAKRENLVFLDVSIDGDPFERMVFEVCSILNYTFMYHVFLLPLVNIRVFVVCFWSF